MRQPGKPFEFAVVRRPRRLQHGSKGKPNADSYIQVTLSHAVPKDGEARVRIFKTYKDAASYGGEGNDLCFSAASESSAT